MLDIQIRNVQLSDGTITNIDVSGDSIVSVQPEAKEARKVIEGSGLIALSGFVDLHTHLREPGAESSEDVLSASRAAAKGGYTAIHAMANTNPVADNPVIVEHVAQLGKKAGYVLVQPIGAVTVGLAGEQLAELGLMNKSRAKVTVFSDDGKCVSDALVMRRALEYVAGFGGVIAQHAQEPRLSKDAQMNEGAQSIQLGLTGWPSVAESSIIARDALLAKATNSRLHICHVSTKESVAVIRWAKEQGIKITAEVTPHHLLLTDDLVASYNPVFKVNPPLRTEEDVMALREAVADGTIDIIATDHAPHAAELKEGTWNEAAFGMIGLETAAAIVYTTLVKTGLIDWPRFEEIMSTKPAQIGSLDTQGRAIAVGNKANIVLFNPDAEEIIQSQFESKSSNSPFVGMSLAGQVVCTIFNGVITVENAKVQKLAGLDA
jgi:dihydroorotase